ncbi:MAG: VCBS repeat-containing protein [Pseudohongiella sp.]|nr:VCBS repeat-containing protein [Pseudohongiella sp.]
MKIPSDVSAGQTRFTQVERALLAICLLLMTGCQSGAVVRASFQTIELAARVPGNGQVLLADIGGDTRTDVLLMSRRPGRVYWFENPAWQFLEIPLLADELRAVAAHSLPVGSPASLTVAGRFSVPGSGTRDQLIWLQNPGRDQIHNSWAASDIRSDVAPDALLWANLSGSGTRVLVASPELEVYTPRQVRSRTWSTMSLLLESTPPILRLRAYDWDLDGREELLAAGPAGVDVIALASRGQFVDEYLLLDSADTGGFLDVAPGQAAVLDQSADKVFVAALSADGTQLSVYRRDTAGGWRQDQVPDTLAGARVIQVADLNQDRIDEIIVGGNSGLQVFYYQAELSMWRRYALHAGGVSDVQIIDLDADGFPELVTAPAEPGPLLLFQNRGRRN